MNMPLVQDDLVFGVTSEILGYLCTLLMEQFWGKMQFEMSVNFRIAERKETGRDDHSK